MAEIDALDQDESGCGKISLQLMREVKIVNVAEVERKETASCFHASPRTTPPSCPACWLLPSFDDDFTSAAAANN